MAWIFDIWYIDENVNSHWILYIIHYLIDDKDELREYHENKYVWNKNDFFIICQYRTSY